MSKKYLTVDVILTKDTFDWDQLIRQTVFKFRDVLDQNLTDPSGKTRTQNTALVRTVFPWKNPLYPHVVCYQAGGNGVRIGGSGKFYEFLLRVTNEVVSDKNEYVDPLTQQIIATIIDKYDDFSNYGLYDLKIVAVTQLPFNEMERLYRKHVEVECKAYILRS